MFFLTYVDVYVARLRGNTYHHSLVYIGSRVDKELTSVLNVEYAVGAGGSRLKCHKRTGRSGGYVAHIRLIAVKHGVHNSFTLGVRKKFAFISEKSSFGNDKFYACAAAYRIHRNHLALAYTHFAHNGAHRFGGYVYNKSFHRLAFYSVYFLVQYAGRTYRQLVAFSSHGLYKNGKVHFTSARNIKAVRGVAVFYP